MRSNFLVTNIDGKGGNLSTIVTNCSFLCKGRLFLLLLQGRWGGVWRAPRDYTFVATDNKQTNVELVKKFDKWKYDDYGVEKRMPWISGPKLTTSRNATGDRQWGTLIGKAAAREVISDR